MGAADESTPDSFGHERKVRKRFATPEAYLRNDGHIELRRAAVQELVGRRVRSVLDMGCGDGRVSLEFLESGANVTLVDAEPAMLERALDRVPERFRNAVKAIESTLSAYEAGPDYDLVLCLGVLAHVMDVKDAIHRLAGWVEPGGMLVVQITDHEEPLSGAYSALAQLKRTVTKPSSSLQRTVGSEVLKTAQDAGLRPVGMRQYWVLPPGLGLLPPRWGRALLRRLYGSRLATLGTEKIFALSRPA